MDQVMGVITKETGLLTSNWHINWGAGQHPCALRVKLDLVWIVT